MTAFVVIVVLLVLAVFAVFAGERYLLTYAIVWDWQWALLYRDGAFVRLLAPGRQWLFRPRDRIVSFDRRRLLAVVAGQDVLTSDSIGVKLSLLAHYCIADPVKLVGAVADHAQELHAALQTALRAAVASRSLDEVLADRDGIASDVKAATVGPLEGSGIAAEAVALRDVMLSRELRTAYAQVVAAKKDGEAALERARGESAALRNLANAAKLLKNNPDLINLRLLQAMSAGRGAAPTFVVGVPQTGADLAARAAAETKEPPEA
jgi:regulator of protease activity HflC (stomatin/prohibitin superfamily)